VLKKSSYRSLEDYTQVASKHAKWATYIRFRIIDHLAYAERYGARRVLRGKVPPQDPWDDETKSYRVAVASTFTSFVQTSDQASIIFVHAPWCTHCRKFWPVFKRLAKEYQEDKRFQFIAIDGTVNDLPRAFVPLEKFPSIFLRRAETKANPELYEGRRIPEHIEKAMLGCLSKA
jgi:thiol-disulfide isomerase/thioredoxin